MEILASLLREEKERTNNVLYGVSPHFRVETVHIMVYSLPFPHTKKVST